MAKTSINDRIREFRSLHGKKQIDFAKELATTQANISQMENGDCVPTGNFFLKLAERYPDANFTWLITGKGAPLMSLEIKRILSAGGVKEPMKKPLPAPGLTNIFRDVSHEVAKKLDISSSSVPGAADAKSFIKKGVTKATRHQQNANQKL